MMQGFNTGSAWSTYTNAAGQGHKLLNQGMQALGKGIQQRRAAQEKQQLKQITDAKAYELKQAQGAFMDALAKDDKTTANNILGMHPELVSGGYVTKAIEANRLGEQAPMTPYQAAQINYLNSKLSKDETGGNYNAKIEVLKYISGLSDPDAELLISRGGLKPNESIEDKVSLLTDKSDVITEAQKDRERNKKEVALEMEPLIVGAKKEAEHFAKNFDEAKTSYNTLKTSMPQLRTMTSKLKKLSETATYTMPGRLWNSALRNLGFDVGDAAVDRANYIATVANQVLPLLRQTFGGAFSIEEGNKLEATLGDPNLSPEEKIAQLNAFIEAQERKIKNDFTTFNNLNNERKIKEKKRNNSRSSNTANRSNETVPVNKQALDWLKNNPDDPRADAVRQRLGI